MLKLFLQIKYLFKDSKRFEFSLISVLLYLFASFLIVIIIIMRLDKYLLKQKKYTS